MFAALPVVNADWNVIAGAVATFVVTAIVTALGFRKGIKKVSQRGKTEVTPVLGASLMDNMSLMMLTEAIKENTGVNREIHHCLIEQNMLLQMGLNKRD